MSPTLLRQKSPLAEASNQLRILRTQPAGLTTAFAVRLRAAKAFPLRATGIEVLQLNVGKVCNQTCTHCHVDAGPERRESMSRETAELCLQVLEHSDIPTLDLTGGAPELNPQFRDLVREARRLGRRVIDRSNLTILMAAGYDDLAEFLASEGVEVVASLPCYVEENCDRQRGTGVYQRSIEALRRLNRLGYGRPGSQLVLNLVCNPVGPSLPPPQPELEVAYRRELRERHGIEFTRLYTITNMPINRFLDDLLRSGQYDAYMEKLVTAFNPATLNRLMCRTTLSVDWRGYLYDCDFNQMLELGVAGELPQHIRDFNPATLIDRPIVTGAHCFGCTAGNGSSCQGTLL
jgi:radical SAM/Cys-rich protein